MTNITALLDKVHAQQSAFAAARALYANRLAPEFSPFEFIQANELRLSIIIAWMLDPRGTHGQGAAFLQVFVRRLNLSWDDRACERAIVRTEVPTTRLDADRRIDILVQSDDRAIAIENKPWAVDQNQQVAAYLTHLDKEFPGDRCLIYLSGNGQPPGGTSISPQDAAARHAMNQFRVIGYGDLLPWITACHSQCRADRVSFFLDEFRRYIQRQFLKVRDMTERNHIVAEMIRTPSTISAAFQVIQAAEGMKIALIKTLGEQLRALAASSGWIVEDREESGFRFRFNHGDEAAVAISFGGAQRYLLSYGVVGIAIGSAEGDRLHVALTAAFGRGEAWHGWLWGRPSSSTDQLLPIVHDWNASDQPWSAISDGSVATTIIRAAQAIGKMLAQHRGDCQGFCVWGHSDADGGRIWSSRRTPWISCWRGVTRGRFLPRTGLSMS